MFGSKAKHFNYMEVDDTKYYRVPTPLTELMFKSNFEPALDDLRGIFTRILPISIFSLFLNP